MNNVFFNGIQKPYLKELRGRTRKTYAPRNHQLITIPGRPGAFRTKTTTDVVYHDIPVGFEATEDQFSSYLIDLQDWLMQDEAKELTFSDDPTYIWYAEIEGSLDFTRNGRLYEGVLRFLCTDPHKYGDQKTVDFENGVATVDNKGTAPASPFYKIDVLDDISHLDIISDDAYMRIGEPARIGEEPYEPQELILHDPLTSMVGWSAANDVDNGHVTGEMTATPSGFEVGLFGTPEEPPLFQGPSVRRTIPVALQDFKMDLTVDLLNVGNETGMIEVYLLDAFGNTVAKVGIEDGWQGTTQVQSKFELGNDEGREVSNRRFAKYVPAWNDYKGVIKLFRGGHVIRPYFALVDGSGKHTWISSDYSYTDTNGDYLAPIVQVQIAMRIYPRTFAVTMRARDLKIWRYNDRPDGVPIIANPGDEIIIDTRDRSISINGEDRKALKAFESSFFDLKKGTTTLSLEPSDKVAGKVTLRERYL